MNTYTVSDWVQWKGGNRAAAAFLGVKVQAISNMKTANRIPPKHHLAVDRDCREQGFGFDPENPAPARSEAA